MAGKKRKYIGLLLSLLVLGLVYYFSLSKNLFPHHHPSSILLDKHGKLLSARISTDEQWHFPGSFEVSDKYKLALITLEDKRFHSHVGVDFLALARAYKSNFKARKVVSGGSTLSMQVIRLHLNNPARNIFQKLREILLATRLELRYSKAEILQMYMDHAPYGGNVIGIQAASWRYFDKSPDQLSWAESCLLAVLPNNPGTVNINQNRSVLESKRNRLLALLLSQEKIDSLGYEASISEELPTTIHTLPNLAPHALQFLQKTQQSGTFHSTLDFQIQQTVARLAKERIANLEHNQIHNVAVLVLDVKKNEVLAYVGNNAQAHTPQKYVDIVQAQRSTGSTLKPFLYSASLDEGILLPQSLLPDYPMQIDDFIPSNYYDQYDGLVPADQALQRSLNIPFAALLQRYGIERFLAKAKELGLSGINKGGDFYGIPLILGGAESSLWDLCNAYAYMSRVLNHFHPNNGLYDKADLNQAKLLQEQKKDTKQLSKAYPIISAPAIWQTVNAMKNIQRPESSGHWKAFDSSVPIAWKTGTSNGFKDAWAIGITSSYAIGVWVGNADGEGRPGIVGIEAAAPLLFQIASSLPRAEWWRQPIDHMQQKATCKQSGMLAGPYCEIDSTWLASPIPEARQCSYHKQIFVDAKAEYQVFTNCYPADQMKSMTVFEIPAYARYYYRGSLASEKNPPMHPSCQSENKGLKIIYPTEQIKILAQYNAQNEIQPIVFTCQENSSSDQIYWHIDNKFIQETQDEHQIEIQLEKGAHHLVVMDEKGNTDEVRFTIL